MNEKLVLEKKYYSHRKRESWLKERKKGIGGSDIGGIVGMSRWKSPLSVYMDKVTPLSMDDSDISEAAYWGMALEDKVAERFELITTKKVHRKKDMIFHKDHDILFANIDRRVVGEKALLEIKTCNAYKASEWDDKVPYEYLLQCQHYLSVTGYETAYIAVLIGGQNFRWAKINRDDELINETLIPACLSFWNNYVLPEKPPAPSDLDVDRQIINDMYQNPNDDELELDKEGRRIVEHYQHLKYQEKLMKESLSRNYNEICVLMGNHTTANSGAFTLSWKPYKKIGFDTKKFKEAEPKMYQKMFDQYLKETEVRPLRISKVKE